MGYYFDFHLHSCLSPCGCLLYTSLFNNPVRLERMQAGAHLLAKTTAAADIADVAYSIAKNK